MANILYCLKPKNMYPHQPKSCDFQQNSNCVNDKKKLHYVLFFVWNLRVFLLDQKIIVDADEKKKNTKQIVTFK